MDLCTAFPETSYNVSICIFRNTENGNTLTYNIIQLLLYTLIRYNIITL